MPPNPQHNWLLARLAPKDLAILRPHLAPVELPLRTQLEKPGRTIEYAYFPDSGIASVVATQSSDIGVEVGLIGREGMTGLAILLGDRQTPNTTYMQLAGAGQRMRADSLRSVMARNPGVQAVMLKYVQAFLIQVSHTAICNANSHINERLARWILMAHDRASGSTILLTHEFLALMLAVRRAGVTLALQGLVAEGLIKAARGSITVLNRKALQTRAGGAYGVPETEYHRLLGKRSS